MSEAKWERGGNLPPLNRKLVLSRIVSYFELSLETADGAPVMEGFLDIVGAALAPAGISLLW